MREQFDAHNIPTPRHSGWSGWKTTSTGDELRMRSQPLVCLDVKINDVSQPYGWLNWPSTSAGLRLNNRSQAASGSKRESPFVYVPCLKKVWEKDFGHTNGSIQPTANRMIIEECKYEDVQDISMSQITYNKEHHLISTSSRANHRNGVRRLGGSGRGLPLRRINGIVRVQPVPDRTFADTGCSPSTSSA